MRISRSAMLRSARYSPARNTQEVSPTVSAMTVPSVSPYFSHYLSTAGQFATIVGCVFTDTQLRCVRVTREALEHFWLLAQPMNGLSGPEGDAARMTRCGDVCQTGEARALAAAASRTAASPQMSAAGQADAIAILMRRTLILTSAPILSSLSRMLPQLALASLVCATAMRRMAHSST